eukprot:12894317-Alexandrium_andersonii.AAC.1
MSCSSRCSWCCHLPGVAAACSSPLGNGLAALSLPGVAAACSSPLGNGLAALSPTGRSDRFLSPP